MTTRHDSILAACLAAGMLGFAARAAQAQASAALALPDLPAASAPRPASAPPPGPRLRSPMDAGQRATAPGERRPERPVTPQISIPFGRSPPPAKDETRALRRSSSPPVASGGVDDAAARCESRVDEQVRATCRAQLARQAKGKPTGKPPN